MHLADVSVHRAEIARRVGEDLDRVVADREQPRLGVVWIGGDHAGGDQRQRRVADRGIVPQRPRRIGVALGQGAAGGIGGAQSSAREGEKERGAAGAQDIAAIRGECGHGHLHLFVTDR